MPILDEEIRFLRDAQRDSRYRNLTESQAKQTLLDVLGEHPGLYPEEVLSLLSLTSVDLDRWLCSDTNFSTMWTDTLDVQVDCLRTTLLDCASGATKMPLQESARLADYLDVTDRMLIRDDNWANRVRAKGLDPVSIVRSRPSTRTDGWDGEELLEKQ